MTNIYLTMYCYRCSLATLLPVKVKLIENLFFFFFFVPVKLQAKCITVKPFNFGLRHENRKENFNQQQITIGDPFFALSPIATLKVNPYRLQLADAFPQTRAKHSEKSQT